ncbi:MAG: hypothetical protein F6J90_34035 [Moorea sp. SIOASIH]|uniref:hypothetical protein n=1 Tax=Moorena sp. SIOASIH TaxID=2607817 RepID=UPI0013B9322D|nr:hypothetical protein [Moorena sp. SIOASIH]NEO41074.1 hypothetical protein [Moorena sp. SIOASIH]
MKVWGVGCGVWGVGCGVWGSCTHKSRSDAEVRPVANLIRLRKTHHYGLEGNPHEQVH